MSKPPLQKKSTEHLTELQSLAKDSTSLDGSKALANGYSLVKQNPARVKDNWKVKGSKELMQAGLFRLRADELELPDGRVMPRYYVMEFPEWVNIIPVTRDGKIVLVEQYRHASGEYELEVPGGMANTPKSSNQSSASETAFALDEKTMIPNAMVESAMAGDAVRELREETGYCPEKTEYLFSHSPNPAMQSNQMHTFIGWNCELLATPEPDPFEDLEVRLVSLEQLKHLVYSSKIRHSLMVASILFALPRLEKEIGGIK